ncbi:hypothetical protein LPJ71_007992 [Coemansia sp. S17]|nr:hypothetical protein LPJ71_007992 [Coemansia sp. S17]
MLAHTQAVEAMTRIRREKTAFTQNVMATLDQSILGEEAVAANAAAVEMEVVLARTATAAAGRQQPSYTSAAGMGAHKVQGRGGQPLLERREASLHWQVSQVVPFTKLQRDSAKALWPAPAWLQEGDETTVLVVSGLRGDATKFAGAACTYIRKALGPKITPGQVEISGVATVDLVVQHHEWSATCKYLHDGGLTVLADLAPEAPRPGGSGSQREDHAQARICWGKLTEIGNSRAARLGQKLLAHYPLPPRLQMTPPKEPRQLSLGQGAEEGEIMDNMLLRPGPAAQLARSVCSRSSSIGEGGNAQEDSNGCQKSRALSAAGQSASQSN